MPCGYAAERKNNRINGLKWALLPLFANFSVFGLLEEAHQPNTSWHFLRISLKNALDSFIRKWGK
jgi:hypothetical protein